MSLSDAAIRSAKPKDTQYKLYDSEGLFLIVTPAGGKWWRLKYYFDGKEKLLSLGVYPDVSLKEARQKRDEAEAQKKAGIDPAAQRKAVKASVRAQAENSFETIAREWHTIKKAGWAAAHAERILARMENHLFPIFGGCPVTTITSPEILVALRRIEATGAMETAHRALQNCSAVFRYAIATGRGENDVAASLRGALMPVNKSNFPTITEPKEVGCLLRAIEDYHGNLIVRFALRLAPYVLLRPGELRRAEWEEFTMETDEWRIPPHKMKMKEVHIVPLSRQVKELLQDLRQYTGHTPYLFPGMRTNTRPISDATLLNSLRGMGYDKDTLVVHSFRSMASTLLNEQGYNRDWIERQLAHGERNSIRAAYNYAEYLPERKKMMQEWADYLDQLRSTTPS